MTETAEQLTPADLEAYGETVELVQLIGRLSKANAAIAEHAPKVAAAETAALSARLSADGARTRAKELAAHAAAIRSEILAHPALKAPR